MVYYQDDDALVLDLEDKAKEENLKALRRGVIKGLGGIPVDKTEKKPNFNRAFLTGVEEAIGRRNHILIFPEGKWRKKDYDYAKGMEIKPGTAHISKKHGMPIIPAYIYCGENFVSDKRMRINFGKPITPDGKTKEEISKAIATTIAELQKDIKVKDTTVQYQF
jgi:1-acyl-sn-glycerol-3-phosphate acyltransferase